MLLKIQTQWLTQQSFNYLLIFTFAVSMVHEVLFHLALLLLLLFIMFKPTSDRPSKIHWLAFFLLLQFPLIHLLRRAIEADLSFVFIEDLIRWALMSALVLWLPKKTIAVPQKTLLMGACAMLITTVAVAFYDVYILELARARGSEHPINMAISVVLFSAIIIGQLVTGKVSPSARQWSLISVALVSGLIAILLSQSRGPLLAWLALAGLFSLIQIKHLAKSPKLLMGLAAVMAIALIAGVYFVSQSGLLARTLAEIKTYQNGAVVGSFGTRIEMWKASLDIYLQHPIIGADKEFKTLKALGGQVIKFDPLVAHWGHAHNELLDALSKRGTIGGLSLIIVWLSPLIIYFNAKATKLNLPWQRLISTQTVLLAWFLCGLTQVYSQHNIGMTLLPLLIAMSLQGAFNKHSYSQSP